MQRTRLAASVHRVGLQLLFSPSFHGSGPLQENIERFVAARQLSNHPIAISDWDKDSDMESI